MRGYPGENIGGDWSDAAQIAQGSSAYATITFAGTGLATTTITPLVQRCGVGNADGIMRSWVDGVLVLEKKDVVFRKHPAIRVDEIWHDHYHGGATKPEAEHGFEMANLVVAADYVGPMRHATKIAAKHDQ